MTFFLTPDRTGVKLSAVRRKKNFHNFLLAMENEKDYEIYLTTYCCGNKVCLPVSSAGSENLNGM